jgi:hypothetical protein
MYMYVTFIKCIFCSCIFSPKSAYMLMIYQSYTSVHIDSDWNLFLQLLRILLSDRLINHGKQEYIPQYCVVASAWSVHGRTTKSLFSLPDQLFSVCCKKHIFL